jgi:hypothetical protein
MVLSNNVLNILFASERLTANKQNLAVQIRFISLKIIPQKFRLYGCNAYYLNKILYLIITKLFDKFTNALVKKRN